MNESANKHSLTEAMELWKRVLDWTDDPFVVQSGYIDLGCFFCMETSHLPHCIWLKAKELVKADEKGLVE